MADEEGVITPEEPAPETVEPEGDTPVVAEEPKPTPMEPSEPKGVGKRLKELTDARRAAEARADALLRLLEQRGEVKAEPKAPDKPKTLKDFDYDESAYTSHLMEAARQDAVEAARAEASKWRDEQAQTQSRQTFESRAKAFAKEHSDFHEVFNESTPVSQAMAEVITQSEQGAEVAYFLGNNPDIARQIYDLSPQAAAREIGRIEARLEYQKSQPKPVSKAPEPAPTIEGAEPGNVEKDPSKMSDPEFRKWFRNRRKRIR